MSFATYFPEQRHMLPLTTIRRDRMLPQGTIGDIEVHDGERVDLRDVIARGAAPSRYVILEAADMLRVKDHAALMALVLVEEKSPVEAGQVIAGKEKGRGRRVVSPVTGYVAYIGDGRIIIQETPEAVDLEAGLIGHVVEVRERRGVVIETTGAVLQGMWGNNRIAIGTLRAEPEAGLESIVTDEIDIQYRGTILISRRPLRAAGLQMLEEQGISGVIAPSMDGSLIEAARAQRAGILLTVGFGAARMNQHVYGFLESLNGKQATLDAMQPSRFDARRPEVIINLPMRQGQRPPPAAQDLALQTGMQVRLTRGNFAGLVGQVVHLPKTPYLLENGLRIPCAQIQLNTGESAFVPLANLEIFGQ